MQFQNMPNLHNRYNLFNEIFTNKTLNTHVYVTRSHVAAV